MYIDGFNMITGINNFPANLSEAVTIEGRSHNVTNQYIQKSRKDTFYERFENVTKLFKLTDLNYDLHSSVKLDFVIHKTIVALRSSEVELLKRDCELQRIQLLTILMLEKQNDKLAGYVNWKTKQFFRHVRRRINS